MNYSELKRNTNRGWNTWYSPSMTAHALLPYGFGINLAFKDFAEPGMIRNLKVGDHGLRPGSRSWDGSYTTLNFFAGKTEIVQQGTIDVGNTVNWQNVPDEGDIDVTILRHEFSIVDKTGAPVDNAFIFYMSPEQDVIYYVHKDKGMLLFPLD